MRAMRSRLLARRRGRRPWRGLLGALALALAAAGAACAAADDPPGALHVVAADRAVDSVLARYVDRALDRAEDGEAAAVLLRIDTPGGSIDAMKDIVGRIEGASVPVVAWVGPPGAAAVSAGTFVALAGHVAAMAPNTTIGAATPVTGAGEDIEGALGRKVTNDAVAFARGVAELRGRNADWAEAAVREARSATPSEALELGVVDLLAATEGELLAAVEGREVELIGGRAATLRVEGAPRVEHPFNLLERVLAIVSDPLVVSLLLLVGLIGIGAELFVAPGTFVPGTAGAIALLLAFLGLGTLLPGEAALALAGLAVALVALELALPTGGVLGAGAAVALALAVLLWLGGGDTGGGTLGVPRGLLVLAGMLAALTLLVAAFVGVLAVRYLAPTRKPGDTRPEGYT